jgi:hypothetical protein
MRYYESIGGSILRKSLSRGISDVKWMVGIKSLKLENAEEKLNAIC